MIDTNLQSVRQRIRVTCEKNMLSADTVRLLAVSKTVDSDKIRAALALGLHDYGENYAQEGLDKIKALQDVRSSLCWHFIGALQSNKTRSVAEQFDWVHSVDRLTIAQRLSQQRPADLPPLQVLIQVNTSQEDSKNGVPPSDVMALAHAMAALPRLQLRGLMALPAPTDDATAQQQAHRQLKTLFDALRTQAQNEQWPGAEHIDTLSMGMSADLEAAIAQGSTLVRVGTAIFGVRPPA